MKKQGMKKLAISKETLRELTDNQTGRIAGGYPHTMLRDDTCVDSDCWCSPPPQ